MLAELHNVNNLPAKLGKVRRRLTWCATFEGNIYITYWPQCHFIFKHRLYFQFCKKWCRFPSGNLLQMFIWYCRLLDEWCLFEMTRTAAADNGLLFLSRFRLAPRLKANGRYRKKNGDQLYCELIDHAEANSGIMNASEQQSTISTFQFESFVPIRCTCADKQCCTWMERSNDIWGKKKPCSCSPKAGVLGKWKLFFTNPFVCICWPQFVSEILWLLCHHKSFFLATVITETFPFQSNPSSSARNVNF